MRRILIIAGSDSSGGAGLGRDAAVAHGLGCEILPVLTAVTAQTDRAVTASLPLPPALVAAQIESAVAGGRPDAVKIGMLATPAIAGAVAAALGPLGAPVVLDPVLRASSGGALFSGAGLDPLLSLVTLLTPNLDEAAALTELPRATEAKGLAAQAARLRTRGAKAVLMKGGHGTGRICTDHLFDADGRHDFPAPRLPAGRRGTGCALATAIACHLAAGRSLADACARAIAETREWIGRTAAAAGRHA